mgnify:CR=1 FL=1
MAKDPRYRFILSKEHVAELHIALESVQTRGLSWEHMAREDFPLPSLSLKLAEIAEELENGSGLAHLSGLPLSKFGDGLRHVWVGIVLIIFFAAQLQWLPAVTKGEGGYISF